MRTLVPIFSLLCLGVGCTHGKPEAEESFADLHGLDAKSDAFSYRLRLLGGLRSGAPRSVLYTATPRFRGFTVQVASGDTMDLWVRGSRGDALTWLLDSRFRVVERNDDADENTLDSFISIRLWEAGTYYVVFRDYYLESRRFTVDLTITPYDDPFAASRPLARDWIGYGAANEGSFGWPLEESELSPTGRAKFVEYRDQIQGTHVFAYGFPTESGETATAVIACQEEIGWVDLITPSDELVAHGASGDGCSAPSWRWEPVDWDPSICDCVDGGYPTTCRWC